MPSGLVLQPRLGNREAIAQHSGSVCSADAAATSNYDVPDDDALGRLDLTFVLVPSAAAVPVAAGVAD